MKKIICSHGQDTIEIKEIALFTGYAFNFDFKAAKKSHIVEVGISKSKYSWCHHPVNTTWYIANDFVLHGSKFISRPKIGGYFGFWGICAGAEAIYYTNFKENALCLAPYLGFGTNAFKLIIKPLIPITNKKFGYMNPVSVSASIQFISLKKTLVE